MTAQIPDKCSFDGRLRDIVEYQGNVEGIPTNDILGISTTTESSSNWSGRIDQSLNMAMTQSICIANRM
jgi:hypothetical protein